MDSQTPGTAVRGKSSPALKWDTTGYKGSFQAVFEALESPSDVSCIRGQFREEDHPWKVRVVHPYHMPNPPQLCFRDERLDARHVSSAKSFCVGDSFAHDLVQVSDMKLIQSSQLFPIQHPGFTTIEQGSGDNCSIDCQLGVKHDIEFSLHSTLVLAFTRLKSKKWPSYL